MLSKMISEKSHLGIQAIYFAAPPTEIKFIMEVRKFLRKKHIQVYTALEMIDYLEDNFSHCDSARFSTKELNVTKVDSIEENPQSH